jgi:ribosomal protein L27
MDQTAERGGRMHAQEQVDVGRDHADFKHVGTVMPGGAS